MKFTVSAAGFLLAIALSGCSALDAMHTASVATSLDDQGVLDGPAADPRTVALRTGTASYTGLGILGVSDGVSGTAYLGDAAILVDFDTASLNGTISMYRGMGGMDPSADPEQVYTEVEADPAGFLLAMNPASGTVSLSGTVSGGTFTADATSTALLYGGTTAQVTGGSVGGEFTGTAADGLRTTTSDVTGTLNGAPADAIELYFAGAG